MVGSTDGKRRLRKAVDAAKEAVSKRVDVATGSEFRNDFEEFTDAVTTSVVGMHGDITDIASRLSQLEDEGQTFREFKDAITGSVEGMRGDITGLVSRLDQFDGGAQIAAPGFSMTRLNMGAFALSLVAVLLSIVALVLSL